MKISSAGQSGLYTAASTAVQAAGSTAFSSALSAASARGMDDIFRDAAEKYDVPLNLLLAVGKAESGFNSNCVSKSGAQGVMQLMPGTAKYLGVSDSFDAEQNIMGGAKYLAEMLNKFGGDVKLALAAYNAGPGNVTKYGGVPPFAETQKYIETVMEYAGMDVNAPSAPVSSAPIVQSAGFAAPDGVGESLKEYILMQILSMQMDLSWNKKS